MPAAQPPDDLEIGIVRILRTTAPDAYCDACLALTLEVSLDQARQAAIRLGRSSLFERKMKPCYRCDRTLELTSAV